MENYLAKNRIPITIFFNSSIFKKKHYHNYSVKQFKGTKIFVITRVRW